MQYTFNKYQWKNLEKAKKNILFKMGSMIIFRSGKKAW